MKTNYLLLLRIYPTTSRHFCQFPPNPKLSLFNRIYVLFPPKSSVNYQLPFILPAFSLSGKQFLSPKNQSGFGET